ncbi:MAG: hypothetical protein SVR08_10530 [Spirochaetota bacterium]|nr:hypothetical protein [Spirochaetota bacterium]
MSDKDKDKDLDIDWIFDEDDDFESIFSDDDKSDEILSENDIWIGEDASQKPRRRNLSDFEPDMDALLLTAQSSMIIEGMKYYSQGDFSSKTHLIYCEARKGIELYIKILERNPSNYRRLKELINNDIDCLEVEKIAFDLYKRIYGASPETDRERLEAFEKFKVLFQNSENKALISSSMKRLKKYLLLSGEVDTKKIDSCIKKMDIDFKKDLSDMHQHTKLAIELLEKGKGNISSSLKGREMNLYIIKATELLIYYHKKVGNIDHENYYNRIHDLYKKYFVIRE